MAFYNSIFLISILIGSALNSLAQVTVNPPSNLLVGTGPSCTNSSLGDIEIIETEKNDFTENSSFVIYVITLPSGFEIANPDETTINVQYIKISSGGASTYTPGAKSISSSGGRRNRFTFGYTIASPSDDTAKIVISGIQISCYQPGSFGNIYRTGGSAVQNGNAVSDQQSHGFLDSRITGFNATAYEHRYSYQESVNGEYSYFSSSYTPPGGTNLVPVSPRETFCQVRTWFDFKIPNVSGATYTLWDNTGQITPNSNYTSSGTRFLRYYSKDTDSGNKDYYIQQTIGNCTYQSEAIDVELNSIPARYDYDFSKDTSFQQDDDPVALNDYIIPPTGSNSTLLGIAGSGINSINSQTTFLFLPGIVKTGTVRPYYVVTDNSNNCQAYYSFEKPLIVSDPLAALPNYIVASKLPPYCANGKSFTIRFEKPSDLPADSILIGYYLSKKTGSVYTYNYLSNTSIVSPDITIDPIKDNYGNNLLYYYVVFKNTSTGTTRSHPGYIALFPERNPVLIGMPDPKIPGDSVIELCSSTKDTIFMRPDPSNGLLDIYMSDPVTSTYNTFTLSASFFKPITGETATNRYFIPQELFEDPDAANKNYNVKFKIRYVYPGSAYGQCPDTITRIIQFATPIEISHGIVSPSAKPYCHGDTILTEITYDPSVTYNSTDRFYWNFGDGLSIEEDSLLSLTHYYSKPGQYLLRFKTLVHSLPPGYCNNDQLDTIQIGAKPIASFDVYKNFENEKANFVSTTTLSEVNAKAVEDSIYLWEWDFGNGDSHTSTIRKDTLYEYAATTILPYPVKLRVTAGWGCSHTIERPIPVFPVHQVTDNNSFTENFDDLTIASGWFNSGEYKLPDTSSWLHGTPSVNKISEKYSGDHYWITSRNNTSINQVGYFDNEKSWVESPCLDLTSLQKPMVALDNWIDADNLFDGAALQYAICDSVAFGQEDWKTIGTTNLGLNWYNSFTVLGKPGSSLEGWTGQNDEAWKYSAYRLDDLITDLSANNSRLVRFRVVWGSNPDNTPNKSFDGFAFDNFLVGQRNRQVLVEEFCDYQQYEPLIATTLTDPQAIRIQYHLRTHTSNDLINNQNKAEPSARALLYGVGKSLPRGIIDGIMQDNEKELMDWGPDAFFRRSLMIAPFDIDVNYSYSGGTLTINGTVERSPVTTAIVSGPFVVQIAMVEAQVTGNNGIIFTNVLRKMLPNSAGHRVEADYDWSTPYTLSEDFSHFAMPESDFIAVVFIQDENTKEIYQSNYAIIPQGDIPFTAQSSSSPFLAAFKSGFNEVYIGPNPASSELKVLFNGFVNEDCSLTVTDAFGNFVKTAKPSSGTSAYIIPTTDMNNGLYHLIIENSENRIVKSFCVIR